eukprot:386436-Prymnesium_polylepis.1
MSTTDADGNAISIHVIPLASPAVPERASDLAIAGSEDTALWVKLWGTVTSGTTMTVRITQLPHRGTLYDVPTSESTSTARPVNTIGQALTIGAGYVMYIPEADASGSPLVRISGFEPPCTWLQSVAVPEARVACPFGVTCDDAAPALLDSGRVQ